jgi:hypothetical protein
LRCVLSNSYWQCCRLTTTTPPLQTHYGSLANDFAYHPNVRPMHMRTQVDEEKREVTFLYKLIDGKAESSHGTRACLPPSLALAHTIDRR